MCVLYSQRRRVLTLLDYGMCGFDETILTWLPLDGEDPQELNAWIDITAQRCCRCTSPKLNNAYSVIASHINSRRSHGVQDRDELESASDSFLVFQLLVTSDVLVSGVVVSVSRQIFRSSFRNVTIFAYSVRRLCERLVLSSVFSAVAK